MLKTALIVITLLGFGYAYEPTRVRMLLVAKPALERMGPLGERIATPVQRYNTATELSFILDQIQLAKTEAKEIPDARTFQTWMQRRILTKNRGRDPWDFPYYLIRVGPTLTVGSVGEDGQQGTDDDIKKSMTL